MYMVREIMQAERGKAQEVVAGFRVLDQFFAQAGYTNRRIYVDYDGPMDTVVYECDVKSLDEYFSSERQNFVDPDEETKALIDAMNNNAKAGRREIYEVIQ